MDVAEILFLSVMKPWVKLQKQNRFHKKRKDGISSLDPAIAHSTEGIYIWRCWQCSANKTTLKMYFMNYKTVWVLTVPHQVNPGPWFCRGVSAVLCTPQSWPESLRTKSEESVTNKYTCAILYRGAKSKARMKTAELALIVACPRSEKRCGRESTTAMPPSKCDE